MNMSRMGRRLAVSGVATAIAAAGLVGATGTAANAATATTTYNCTFPIGGAQNVDVTVSAPALDAVAGAPLPAGQPITEGFLNLGTDHAVDIAMKLPSTIAGTLGTLGVSAIDAKDLGMAFGSSTVPVTGLKLGSLAPNPDGSAVVNATGTNDAFAIPAAGSYDITMPSSFTMIPTLGGGIGAVDIPCTATGTPAALNSTPVSVVKNSSTTVVKAPASIKKGAVAKLVASVKGGFNAATGKVSFFDGTKKLGTSSVKSGKAAFAAKGLKVGKHTITAKYAGDGFRNASKSKAVVVKVVR